MSKNNPILQWISGWFVKNFSDPEALALFFTLLFGFLLIKFFGHYLLPVVISAVIAYLFSSPVQCFKRWHCPHWLAVTVVYLFFLSLFFLVLFGLFPLMWKQLVGMIHEFPKAVTKGKALSMDLACHYPKIFPDNPLNNIAIYLQNQSARIGRFIVSFSLSSIPSIIEIILYFVLVPLLVFFFLKDSNTISHWLNRFLPERRGLIQIVWYEMNQRIGAYVRGRVVEVLIVSAVAVTVFTVLGLRYAFLLGVLLGLSVIVPYIGAVIITIPIVIISLTQWGLSPHFACLMIVYVIIITLDGNLLVPLLFSDAMDLHPIIIILSVLVFGGIWGFWGVFFAIPLATLIKTILSVWPKSKIPCNPEKIVLSAKSKSQS